MRKNILKKIYDSKEKTVPIGRQAFLYDQRHERKLTISDLLEFSIEWKI